MIRDRMGVWARKIGVTRWEHRPSPCEAGQDVGRSLQHCPAVGLSDDGIAIGEWPADPHTVPAWVLRCDARGAAIGIEPLLIRTRADFEQACELCTMTVEMETAEYQSAVKFLAWLHATNRVGTFDNAQLSNAWNLFCKEIGHIPASEAHMRSHLARLKQHGVSRELQEKSKGKGRRNRPTIWTIAPDPATSRIEHREPLRLAA